MVLPVAIKRLGIDKTRFVESKWQFDAGVLTIRRANHPIMVGFIGFCTEGNRRLVVYEYMTLGSLDNLLRAPTRATLDWNTRMKIFVGAVEG
ncbi:putative serine/threonine-protein kinase PBL6 [Bienertia sinuspersici]